MSQTEHLYTNLEGSEGGCCTLGIDGCTLGSDVCTLVEVGPPRASMMRQRAKYSSSVGSRVRGLLVLLPLVHDSREAESNDDDGGAAVGEFKASSAIA